MNHKSDLKLLTPLLALAFAGCVGTPTPPDSSPSHPANVRAAQGIVPRFAPMLMNFTNLVTLKPVTEPAPEHQHGHDATKAKTEEAK
jgi:hypothetical protein